MGTPGNGSVNVTQGKAAQLRRLAILTNIVTIGVLVWMFLSGLVTYVPGMSADEMQNIYIAHILFYSSISAILQCVAIGLVIRAGRVESDSSASVER